MDIYPAKKRSEIMRAVRTERTRPERLVRSGLHRRGLRFARSHRGLIGKPDLVLPKYGTVVFVHGCMWHGHDCPRGGSPKSNSDFWRRKIEGNRARDARVRRELRSLGWKVLTVWECQLSAVGRRERTLSRLEAAIRANRNGTPKAKSD